MSQLRELPDRVVVLARRIAGTPEWPMAAAGALSLLALVDIVFRADGSGTDLPIALLLGLCTTAPVALARTNLLAAAGTITVASLLLLVTPPPLPGAALIALAAALYLVGLRRSGRVAGLVLVPFAGYAVAGLAVHDRVGDRSFGVVLAALAAAAVGWGGARRSRARQREKTRLAVADTLLEHAARGERARIARELHDVVAHHISMIAVQAETARLATAGMPADGARQLLAIGDTARTALTEMRRLLGVLREDADPRPTREPQPGLQQLVELVDQARDSAGASTRLIVRGRVRPLDPGVELTAYRIVQEALTNARRHAPGAAVDVTLSYLDDMLELRVRDNGAGTQNGGPGGGLGLLGMRERAAAVGGQLWTGPGPVSGFLVEARLPASDPAPGSAPASGSDPAPGSAPASGPASGAAPASDPAPASGAAPAGVAG